MRLLMGLVFASLAAVGPDLLAIGDAPLGSGLPAGWQGRAVRGFQLPDVSVVERDGERALLVEGAGRAGWLHREIRGRTVDNAVLRWSWRVDEALASGDLARPSADDSPLRVYVIFGNPRSIFGGSGRIIFYSFGNDEPDGFETTSHVSNRIHVIRVAGARDRSTWMSHSVRPADDYQRIWGRRPPRITAVGLMQDTDQTGERAAALIRALVLTNE
ncbi:MAG: DUF3047 domain-containing protein [Gemmatimonadales bacterium]